jgi:hypothetical protein
MREKMKEMQMQIQIPGYGENSQELKPNVPGLPYSMQTLHMSSRA